MFKPIEVFIGLRYILSRAQPNHLVSFISALAITGLVLGVGLLIVVMSVMNGFERELRERILNLVPHIVLINQQIDADWHNDIAALDDFAKVQEITPYAELQGLIHVRGNTQPLRLIGFADGRVPKGFASMLSEQSLGLPGVGEILLSGTLMERLQVSQGQSVRLVFPGSKTSKTQVKRFTVKGAFATHTELDQVLAIGSLQQVGSIAGFDSGISGFRVQLDDPFEARNVGYQLLENLPYGYGFRDWFQTHGNLYQAIQLSRNMVGLLIFMIVAIAAFNVVSMLMMSVLDKRRDIAILQTLGLSRGSIVQVFLVQGLAIGALGITSGVLLGVAGCLWVADLIGWIEQLSGRVFLDTAVYPIDYVPVDMRGGDILLIASVAALLNGLATVFPAIRASRIAPAKELRY
ncbi:MAG: ABC transporter permease [Porticoccaceae bacterium]|nr:ABC transporter permease [Porticoccaceae bacterium]